MDSDSPYISLSDIFRFLAQSMRYPDETWFNDNFRQIFMTILGELQWQDQVIELETAWQTSEIFLEDVQVEHTRLFINAIPSVIAPPYASVYYKGDGTLYGAIAEQTKQFYREKGFELEETGDVPDHIVFELEFLALLAGEDQQGCTDFLNTLFTPWFILFKSKVLEEAHHPYYKVVVQLIDFFTREEL